MIATRMVEMYMIDRRREGMAGAPEPGNSNLLV